MKILEVQNTIIYNVTLSHPDISPAYHDFIITENDYIWEQEKYIINDLKNYFKNTTIYHNIKIEYTLVVDNKILHKVVYEGSIY